MWARLTLCTVDSHEHRYRGPASRCLIVIHRLNHRASAETFSGSGVWLVFSLRTLVCADGLCGRVRTFVVTRVPCSV
eukprot:4606479-Prymnesium_polylepis.3